MHVLTVACTQQQHVHQQQVFHREHHCLLVPICFSFVCSGAIAQLSLPAQDEQNGEAQEAATPHMTMDVDWDLGVSGHSDDIAEEDEVPASNCQ